MYVSQINEVNNNIKVRHKKKLSLLVQSTLYQHRKSLKSDQAFVLFGFYYFFFGANCVGASNCSAPLLSASSPAPGDKSVFFRVFVWC
jgi:hypothetical protein